jgi:TolB-like protein/class 3 adenylate cyclase/Flp pilus assembly protein TadD
VAREQRKLAAIVAADVVGYSRLMGRDESGTLARLRKNRSEYLDPVLAKYGGRLVKLTGDGALVEFASAVDALSAAIEFQQAMAEANSDQPAEAALVFRMGLHLGDLIVEGDDLYGDGVNVAARLEGEAPAGGILISSNVRDAVDGRLKATFQDVGSLSLKNIERPVRAFRVHWEALDWHTQAPPDLSVAPAVALQSAPTPLPLPDKPSIAVLPFQNMSGDTEQEYFADGMVEDIITSLSRNKQLFVIARNSSFAYKGKSPDIRQVGRELGVHYVLEGSVRRSRSRVRISGQLIDASSGVHMWADRFDGELSDIFELQDQMTSSVVGGILPMLEKAEIERAKRKVGHLEAYDYFLRSRAAGDAYSAESRKQALALARQAVALDPNFALGHALIAGHLNGLRSFGWSVDRASEDEETDRAIRRALELDSNDPRVLAYCGQAMVINLHRLREGAALLDQAVQLDPNFARGLIYRGSARIALDDPEGAIGDLERAQRLSPLDPLKFYALTLMGRAHTLSGHYDKALSLVTQSLRLRPNFGGALLDCTVAHALNGDLNSARQTFAAYQRVVPDMTIGLYRQRVPHLSASGAEVYVGALRLAGMPE